MTNPENGHIWLRLNPFPMINASFVLTIAFDPRKSNDFDPSWLDFSLKMWSKNEKSQSAPPSNHAFYWGNNSFSWKWPHLAMLKPVFDDECVFMPSDRFCLRKPMNFSSGGLVFHWKWWLRRVLAQRILGQPLVFHWQECDFVVFVNA